MARQLQYLNFNITQKLYFNSLRQLTKNEEKLFKFKTNISSVSIYQIFQQLVPVNIIIFQLEHSSIGQVPDEVLKQVIIGLIQAGPQLVHQEEQKLVDPYATFGAVSNDNKINKKSLDLIKEISTLLKIGEQLCIDFIKVNTVC